MDSLQESLRQVRISIIAVVLLISVGVIGFMLIENLDFINALWLTVITLATVGYGDVFAKTNEGKIFTILLLSFGLSIFAFGLQATALFLLSPAIREMRYRARMSKMISQLGQHYIVCGVGELVNQTVEMLLQRSERRRQQQQERMYSPVDTFLDRLLGDDDHGHHLWLRIPLRNLFMLVTHPLHRDDNFLNRIVIITHDTNYAKDLRAKNLLVIEGESDEDNILKQAGVTRARAIMVMLDKDTENLLTVMAARSLNANIYITAGVLDEGLAPKMLRQGANNVIAPYEIAGQTLNNATLRPAVNDFFYSILFDNQLNVTTTPIEIHEGSPWVGKTLGELRLKERFGASILGVRVVDGHFKYTPTSDYRLQTDEIVIAVLRGLTVPALHADARNNHTQRQETHTRHQLPPMPTQSREVTNIYSLVEAEEAVAQMSQHYILCGSDTVMRRAVSKLNPQRPFVIVSDDGAFVSEMIREGFRVIMGRPSDEEVLQKAGIERALAVMVSVEDRAEAVFTVMSCRACSKRILITVTAHSQEIVPKLRRAGADRVSDPFSIAARYVLLSTTRPSVSDFFQYILFNMRENIETTELYMQHDSPWIGSDLATLSLLETYNAGVIGIRTHKSEFVYAPPPEYRIEPYDVLIVITPMQYADELRDAAHGGTYKRPFTLRNTATTTTAIGSRSEIERILREADEARIKQAKQPPTP
jgi:voltage-gated potassium channel